MLSIIQMWLSMLFKIAGLTKADSTDVTLKRSFIGVRHEMCIVLTQATDHKVTDPIVIAIFKEALKQLILILITLVLFNEIEHKILTWRHQSFIPKLVWVKVLSLYNSHLVIVLNVILLHKLKWKHILSILKLIQLILLVVKWSWKSTECLINAQLLLILLYLSNLLLILIMFN